MEMNTLLLRQLKEEMILKTKHFREAAEMRIRHEKARAKLNQKMVNSKQEI